MNTENDTFKALIRTPIKQLMFVKSVWLDDDHDMRNFEELLIAHGWTYDEYSAYMSGSNDY